MQYYLVVNYSLESVPYRSVRILCFIILLSNHNQNDNIYNMKLLGLMLWNEINDA